MESSLLPEPPVSLRQIGRQIETVFAARAVELSDIKVFSNAPADLLKSWQPAYQARLAQSDEVSLVQLHPSALVSGKSFAVLSERRLVAEQLTPNDPTDYNEVAQQFARPPVRISEEAVVIARYGEGTWGHWLVELLPKVALCERHSPGRFKYAMPDWVLQGGLMRDRILESTAAYGVSEDRFLRMRSDTIYQFDKLYAVTPVYTDHIPHPDILSLMNSDILSVLPHEARFAKVALVRSDHRRSIHNFEEVKGFLNRHRFTLVDLGVQSFIEQIRVFRSARTLFSVLGSSLSGLLYSPAGARVVAAAPTRFGDRFFYGILQTKPGSCWAEVRGPIVKEDLNHYRDSSFELPADALELAIGSVAA